MTIERGEPPRARKGRTTAPDPRGKAETTGKAGTSRKAIRGKVRPLENLENRIAESMADRPREGIAETSEASPVRK